MPHRLLDLQGKQFGDLEVLELCGRTEKGASLWRCFCHRCGSECILEGQRLTAKKNPKRDCGCRGQERMRDLSGETFGALTVLGRAGNSKSGDKLCLCRCSLCGQEKPFPSGVIRTAPKSCGCQQYKSARMKRMSEDGVSQKFLICENGKRADMAAAKSDRAMRRSQTGVRGVFPEKNRPGTYRFSVQVAGERFTQTGFLSIESAKRAYDKKKEELLRKHGLL